MIRVLFFAKLREDLGVARLEIAASGRIRTIDDLVDQIAGQLQNNSRELLSSGQIVISRNHEVVARTAPIADGDEIAFYPPVTGG